MSIADHFGKRGGSNGAVKIGPPMPMAMPPLPHVVETRPPHDSHAQAIVYVNDLVEANDFLRQENAKLRQDGALALMRIKDLEREAAERFRVMEAYRRYAVEVRTRLETVLDAATRANEAALDASESAPPMPDEALKTVVDAVEKELAAAVEAKPQEAA